MSVKYTYFYGTSGKYGCFSQWYEAQFVGDDGITYRSAEQYMMAQKAILFKDDKVLSSIMKATTQKEIKSLGRKISNFNQQSWDKNKSNIVYNGNHLKFSQNLELLEVLLSTGDSIIAEASPTDRIWGIGMSARKDLTKNEWKGENLLGEVLMDVRKALSD